MNPESQPQPTHYPTEAEQAIHAETLQKATIHRSHASNTAFQMKVALKVFESQCGSDPRCAITRWVDKDFPESRTPSKVLGEWVEEQLDAVSTQAVSCVVDGEKISELVAKLQKEFNPSVH